MYRKIALVAALAACFGGAHAASTTVTNGTLTATINDAGNFDDSAATMLSWMGTEFIKHGTYSSWYWFDESGTAHIAQYSANPLLGTTYAAGAGAAATTIALGGWTFSQVVLAAAPDKLTVTLNVTNNTGADALRGAWGVGFDPDQGIPSLGTFVTDNKILATGGASAVSATAAGLTVTLQNDTSAGAFIINPYINVGDCCTAVDPHVALAAGQAAGFGHVGDDSISLAYDLGTIKNGQTVSIGYSYIFAVPEPETYAMLLAGLGVIGFLSRRRQAK